MNELSQTRIFREKPRDSRKYWSIIIMIVLAILFGYILFAISRNIPASIQSADIEQNLGQTNLVWPNQGSAAVGVVNNGTVICRSYGPNVPQPTASIAKVITALVVLEKYPLQIGAQGPDIVMQKSDVDLYNQTVAAGGSNLPISLEEKLTEREILEGMMIVSSDNMADSLANWAFGDFANYKIAAQTFLEKNHLNSTNIGDDASGLDPATTSNSSDLCQLMNLALKNPTLISIMSTTSIDNFANSGAITNTNQTLGRAGIFAGKTGSLGTGFYNLLTASRSLIDGKSVTTINVVMGQNNFSSLFSATEKLSSSVIENLGLRKISRNQVVGIAKNPDGSSVELIAQSGLSIATFKDQQADLKLVLSAKNLPLRQGTVVGKITDKITGQSVNIITKNSLARPQIGWLLAHPF